MNYLIVGASSGLGRDLAYKFAQNSNNLILVSRDERDLKALKNDIEVKFKLNETDPLSESSPAIWENWEDFVEKADDFAFMIEGLETSSADTLAAGLGNIGQSCGSCHKAYRIKK